MSGTAGIDLASPRRAKRSDRAGRPTRRRPSTRLRNRALVGLVLLVTVLGGAFALAFWTVAGAGSGAARSGVAGHVILSPGTAAPTLFPGGRADVALVMTNPDGAALTVPGLMLDQTRGTAGFDVDAAHTGCDLHALDFQPPDAGAGWTVPGRTGGVDGTLAVTLPGAVTMATDAGNACQGAYFDVHLVAAP